MYEFKLRSYISSTVSLKDIECFICWRTDANEKISWFVLLHLIVLKDHYYYFDFNSKDSTLRIFFSRILFCQFNLCNHQTHFLNFSFPFSQSNLYQYPTKYLVLISSSSHYYIMFILQVERSSRSKNFLILSWFENLAFVSHGNAVGQVVVRVYSISG